MSDVAQEAVPTFAYDVTVVGATAVEVVASPGKTFKGIQLKAGLGNAGIVYIGDADVTTANGYPLDAGETLFLPVDDMTIVFAVASEADQDLHWITA